MSIESLREWYRTRESDPHSIDFVNAFAEWWPAHGPATLNTLRTDETTITDELRVTANRFALWFRERIGPDAGMNEAIRQRISAQREIYQGALAEWHESIARIQELEREEQEAGRLIDTSSAHQERSRRLTQLVADCDSALSSFNTGTEPWETLRRTLANVVEDIEQFTAVNPWQSTSLFAAIGTRKDDGFPSDRGIFSIAEQVPYTLTRNETRADGSQVTITQRGFGPDEPADRLIMDCYQAELAHRLNHRTLPIHALRDFRRQLRKSPWFCAFLIDGLIRCDACDVFSVLINWLKELDPDFEVWQVSQAIERFKPQKGEIGSQYSFAFDLGVDGIFGFRIDWPTIRRWQHDGLNPNEQSAHAFSVAIRFLVTRLLDLSPQLSAANTSRISTPVAPSSPANSNDNPALALAMHDLDHAVTQLRNALGDAHETMENSIRGDYVLGNMKFSGTPMLSVRRDIAVENLTPIIDAAIAAHHAAERVIVTGGSPLRLFDDPFPAGSRVRIPENLLQATLVKRENRCLEHDERRSIFAWCYAFAAPWCQEIGFSRNGNAIKRFFDMSQTIADACKAAIEQLTNANATLSATIPASKKVTITLRRAMDMEPVEIEEILRAYLFDAGRLTVPPPQRRMVEELREPPYLLEISQPTLSRRLKAPQTLELRTLVKTMFEDRNAERFSDEQ